MGEFASRDIGGGFPTGLTTEKLQEANVNTRRTAVIKKQGQNKAAAANQVPLIAWKMLYNKHGEQGADVG